jgi:hypothetical protein
MTTSTNYNHPFSRGYHESELEKIKIEPREYKDIVLKKETINGRLDGYMYKDYVIDYENVPVLFIDNTLWMSITPMEIESHYMPIKFAKGSVGVGGLGLGYYVQRILDKEEVTDIVVYETNQDVIDFYIDNFGSHEKLRFIKQDVREMKNQTFDFFYCDIYAQQLDLDAVKDMALLTGNNNISHYHFWTIEGVLLEMLLEGHQIPLMWRNRYGKFISDLIDEKENMLNPLGVGDDFYDEFIDYRLI